MNPHTQHRLTEQKAHYQSLIDGNTEALLPIEKALGKYYQQRIIDCLKNYKKIGVTQLSTTAIMDELGWKGKSYFTNQALKQLEQQQKITGTKVYNWLWSIKND